MHGELMRRLYGIKGVVSDSKIFIFVSYKKFSTVGFLYSYLVLCVIFVFAFYLCTFMYDYLVITNISSLLFAYVSFCRWLGLCRFIFLYFRSANSFFTAFLPYVPLWVSLDHIFVHFPNSFYFCVWFASRTYNICGYGIWSDILNKLLWLLKLIRNYYSGS